MINNVRYNEPAFTSTVRMSQKTAKVLHDQPQKIQRAIMNDIRTLSSNGRNDIVNISYTEQISRKIKPTFFHIYEERALKVNVLERRGADYYASSARKSVLSGDGDYDNPIKLMDLYKAAKRKMKKVDTVSNKFMQYV